MIEPEINYRGTISKGSKLEAEKILLTIFAYFNSKSITATNNLF